MRTITLALLAAALLVSAAGCNKTIREARTAPLAPHPSLLSS